VTIAKQLPIHNCVVCRELPIKPFDPADVDPGQEYRPAKPLAIVSGKTSRSFRCFRHARAKKKADSAKARAYSKNKLYGVPAGIQQELWVFQGCSCPCGRKRSKEVPAGVTLDHSHTASCIKRGDHPENLGCMECVTGFVCAHCNREIIGRLECAFRKESDPRAAVAAALAGIRAHVVDPPMRRYLRQREAS
jgi:hypothetical protein